MVFDLIRSMFIKKIIYIFEFIGVGYTRKPPIYLQHNDKIEIEIEQIGTLTNLVEYENHNSKL